MNADNAIKNRKTQKVLSIESKNIESNSQKINDTIDELLDLAAYAPYHKKCHEKYSSSLEELNSCVPWRFYVLDTVNCKSLLDYILKKEIKAGKIADMLLAADALLMVTWLPDPVEQGVIESQGKEAIPFEGNIKNMEHIAAASAAIQNVLVGATARNIPNYWSSGGQLRNPQLRQYMNISLDEVLLGALFLFPEDTENRNATVKLGSLRDQGKEKSTWSKHLNLQ